MWLGGLRVVEVGDGVVDGDVVRLPVVVQFRDGSSLGGFLGFDFDGVVGPDGYI